jgi:hypothetical protein
MVITLNRSFPVQPESLLSTHLEPEGADEQGGGQQGQEDSDKERQEPRARFPEPADGHPEGTGHDQKTANQEEQTADQIVSSHRVILPSWRVRGA